MGEGMASLRRPNYFLALTLFLSLHPNALFLQLPCQDLMVIRSKREKKREEEKKKSSSFLLGDLVKIPSDLYEKIRAEIFFFKI